MILSGSDYSGGCCLDIILFASLEWIVGSIVAANRGACRIRAKFDKRAEKEKWRGNLRRSIALYHEYYR